MVIVDTNTNVQSAIELLKTFDKMVTHPPRGHLDEELAMAIVMVCGQKHGLNIVSTRLENRDSKIPKDQLAIDVGRIYDPEKLRFDHHQDKFQAKWDGTRYFASAGLVWEYFGMILFDDFDNGKEMHRMVSDGIIRQIDEFDLGITYDKTLAAIENLPSYIIMMTLTEMLVAELRSVQKRVEAKQAYPDQAIVYDNDIKTVDLMDSNAIFHIYEKPNGKIHLKSVPMEENPFKPKVRIPVHIKDVLDFVEFIHQSEHMAVIDSVDHAHALAGYLWRTM